MLRAPKNINMYFEDLEVHSKRKYVMLNVTLVSIVFSNYFIRFHSLLRRTDVPESTMDAPQKELV